MLQRCQLDHPEIPLYHHLLALRNVSDTRSPTNIDQRTAERLH